MLQREVREVGGRGLAGKGNWGGAASEMEGNPGQKSAVESTRGRSSKMTREHHMLRRHDQREDWALTVSKLALFMTLLIRGRSGM